MTSQNMVVSSLNCWLDLAASRGFCASSAELAESCEDIPAQEDAMLQVSVPAGRIYPSVAWLSLAIEPGKGRCAEHPDGFCTLLFRVCRCVLEPPKFSRGIVALGLFSWVFQVLGSAVVNFLCAPPTKCCRTKQKHISSESSW